MPRTGGGPGASKSWRKREEKIGEEQEDSSGSSSWFRGLGPECRASPLSTSGEWFCPKPRLLGDSEIPNWGHPLLPLSWGFRLPSLELACELGQHCVLPRWLEDHPRLQDGLHALHSLARHTLTFALTQSCSRHATALFLLSQLAYCLSSSFSPARIPLAHLFPPWQTPVFPGDPTWTSPGEDPPTPSPTALEHPLSDGWKSSKCVCLQGQICTLPRRERVPLRAAPDPYLPSCHKS